MSLKRIFVFFLVVFLLGLFSYFYPQVQEITGNTINQEQTEYPKEPAILERVVDGDTIVYRIDNITYNCRLLGINAPEKKMPFSNESKAFLEQFINQTVYLQRDIEDEDKYYRKLRYVFAGENRKRFLNLELLELGYASSYIFGEQTYNKEILRAEEQARNAELGIWQNSQEPCAVHSCIVLEELNATEEFFTIKNECDFSCDIEGWFVKDTGRNTFYLFNMSGREEKTYPSESKEVWNDDKDNFFMFDKAGKLVILYSY